MIPFPINPATDCSEAELIGEGGFPHSEIVGSKSAHNSPTLIAACHVLHRLCMPRHPPNALTSHLRVHTTNDNAGQPIRRSNNHSACIAIGLDHRSGEPNQHPDADVIIISALNWIARANSDDTHCATHIQLTIRRPKTECRRGIDLKNPFTMSNIADGHLVTVKPLRKTQRNSLSSSLEYRTFREVVEPIGIEPMT